ncbi:MAG: hypothetical protein KAT65_23280 [Methanophagales archaeon]|nr:hypothetical protein [Methanophagales archaeon]
MTFEAMYYPYASIRNQETLMQSLLYFDKIHVLSPHEWTIQENLEQIREISGDRDLISIIDPLRILEEYGSEFFESVKDDINDQYFGRMKQEEKTPFEWILYDEKLGINIKRTFSDKINIQGGLAYVEGDLGESILINHTILACIGDKLTPFTDKKKHQDVLTHKMQRNFEKYKKEYLSERDIKEVRQNLLAQEVIKTSLPSVTGIKVTDVLNFRDGHKRELKSFRKGMASLADTLKSKPWSHEFEAEIEKIKDNIMPKVEDLKSDMQTFQSDMKRKYTKKIIPVVASLALTAYTGSLSLVVVGGSIISSGVYTDIFDDLKEYKNLNSLTYLFEIKKIGRI